MLQCVVCLLLTGGRQCSTKEELSLVKQQLASLQSVIDCLLEVSIQCQLNHMSGRSVLKQYEMIHFAFCVNMSFLF